MLSFWFWLVIKQKVFVRYNFSIKSILSDSSGEEKSCFSHPKCHWSSSQSWIVRIFAYSLFSLRQLTIAHSRMATDLELTPTMMWKWFIVDVENSTQILAASLPTKLLVSRDIQHPPMWCSRTTNKKRDWCHGNLRSETKQYFIISLNHLRCLYGVLNWQKASQKIQRGSRSPEAGPGKHQYSTFEN